VKFKVDENLSVEAAEILRDAGYAAAQHLCSGIEAIARTCRCDGLSNARDGWI
jgi:hypothetical protein